MNRLTGIIGGAAVAFTMGVSAQAQNWDMPTPYSDAIFHTANIIEFAADLKAATDGAMDITVHSAGSLFKHADIKGAVRGRQVPIGEFFLSRLSNEDAAFGLDSQPFLATSYEDAERLWAAQKPAVTALLAEQNLMPLFAVFASSAKPGDRVQPTLGTPCSDRGRPGGRQRDREPSVSGEDCRGVRAGLHIVTMHEEQPDRGAVG